MELSYHSTQLQLFIKKDLKYLVLFCLSTVTSLEIASSIKLQVYLFTLNMSHTKNLEFCTEPSCKLQINETNSSNQSGTSTKIAGVLNILLEGPY